MRIADNYNLEALVLELEVALQIDGVDFEVPRIETVVQEVRKRIARQYQIDLQKLSLDDVNIEKALWSQSALLLMDNLTMLHGKVTGYNQITRWKRKSDLALSSINYLGYTKASLKAVLAALQMYKTQPTADAAMQSIKEKIVTVPLCLEKRIFMVLIVTWELGCTELTAALAEILYMGLL